MKPPRGALTFSQKSITFNQFNVLDELAKGEDAKRVGESVMDVKAKAKLRA